MATVKQQVLDWLYSVLSCEYRNLNRTYTDVVQLLTQWPSLSPKTDVYTYENGTSALLLHISGTIPVVFRGTCYRFPIAIWVPHLYPMEVPMVYVIATDGMIIRPGQHVDLQGKLYHPYLVGWAENPDRSCFLDFIEILRDVFSIEPPIISRPPNIIQNSNPPRTPPKPPGINRPTSQLPQKDERSLPPLPPKPTANYQQLSPSVHKKKLENNPPLPPIPRNSIHENFHQSYQNQQLQGISNHTRQRERILNYGVTHPRYQPNNYLQSSQGPSSPSNVVSPPSSSRKFQEDPPNNNMLFLSHQTEQVSYPHQLTYPSQQLQTLSPQNTDPLSAQVKSQAPPDLLSTPLILTVPPSLNVDCPAPPIPPNPERDLLLQKIGHALHSHRQQRQAQMRSSFPGLQAQHNAMLVSLEKMEAEVHALESLKSLFVSNTNALHSALQDANNVISSSQHRVLPGVDELLVAPSIVASQLYELVSEERSLGDVLFILSRAVEKGRISATVFAKMTRSFSREWYLKKALIRKIGYGMGLTAR